MSIQRIWIDFGPWLNFNWNCFGSWWMSIHRLCMNFEWSQWNSIFLNFCGCQPKGSVLKFLPFSLVFSIHLLINFVSFLFRRHQLSETSFIAIQTRTLFFIAKLRLGLISFSKSSFCNFLFFFYISFLVYWFALLISFWFLFWHHQIQGKLAHQEPTLQYKRLGPWYMSISVLNCQGWFLRCFCTDIWLPMFSLALNLYRINGLLEGVAHVAFSLVLSKPS